MSGIKIDCFESLGATLNKLQKPGLLLVAGREKANPMTIGWATIGVIWGLPICVVLVRPSRYTHDLLETCGDFTVNVPADHMVKAVQYCGTHSGRDGDKAAACGLAFAPSSDVEVPYLVGSALHYECRTVHTSDVRKANLRGEIATDCYPQGDFHTVYYGRILGTYRAP